MAGAVVNQAPELFTGVVAQVPFADALNTILDPTQPLTVTEWEEWGNPAESEEIFRAIAGLLAVREHKTRSITRRFFATGGFHDTRVNYWEPAKWVQQLRHTGAPVQPRSCSGPISVRAMADRPVGTSPGEEEAQNPGIHLDGSSV